MNIINYWLRIFVIASVLFSGIPAVCAEQVKPFNVMEWLNQAVDYLSNIQIHSKSKLGSESASGQEVPDFETEHAWFLDPPTSIQIMAAGPDQVYLTWMPPNDYKRVAGYHLYRRLEGQSEFHKVNQILITGFDYRDTVPVATVADYYLVSVTAKGEESRHSEYVIFSPVAPLGAVARQGQPGSQPVDRTLKGHREFPAAVLQKTTDGETWIQMADRITIGEYGNPALPRDTMRFLIPAGMTVTGVHVTNVKRKTLGTQLKVAYQRPYSPIASGFEAKTIPAETVIRNASVYAQATEYPGEIAAQDSIQYLNGYAILIVRLNPVQFVPKTGRVDQIVSLDVIVDLKQTETAAASAKSINLFRNRMQDVRRLEAEVENPQDASGYQTWARTQSQALRAQDIGAPIARYDYLVICPDAFAAAYQPLVDYKNSKGIAAKVVTLTEVQASQGAITPDSIRNYIKWAYQNWNTTYVLLGADVDKIPAKGLYASVGSYVDNNIPADLFYGCLDGVGAADLYAEVFIGRDPADTVQQVTNFVNKVLNYSTTPSSDPSRKRIVLLGENLDPYTWGEDCMKRLEPLLSNFDLTRKYDRAGQFTGTDVINLINSNVNVINHLGHANEYYDMRFYYTGWSNCTNTRFPVVVSQGCYPGAFDYNDSWSEVAINSAAGPSAVISNSRYGWYYRGGDYGPSQWYHEEFTKEVFRDSMPEIGKAMQKSKERLIGLGYNFPWLYWCINLLGDPQMQIYNAQTKDLSVQISTVLPAWVSGTTVINAAADGGVGTITSLALEYSLDGVTWQLIASGTSGSLTANWDTRLFDVQKDVQLRATVRTNSNEAAVSPITKVSVDNVVPATTCLTNPGWYSSAIGMVLNVQDSGSGVAATYYTLDGSTPNAQSARYTGPFNVATTGRFVMKFYSVDKVNLAQSIKTTGQFILDNGLSNGWPVTTSGSIFCAPTLANIDGDAALEVIFGSQDGKLRVLKANAAPAFGFPLSGFCGGASSAAVGDINGDGQKEIIIGGSFSGIMAVKSDGTMLTGWPVKPENATAAFGSSPALGDMNHDGKLDVVIGALGRVYVYNGQGQLLPGWPQAAGTADQEIFSSPAIADLDGDGDLEIVIGSRGTNAKVYAWHHNGAPVVGFPVSTEATWVTSSPVLANIDSEAGLEIIIGGGDTNKVYAWHANGAAVPGFPFQAPGGHFPAAPALADLNGDGSPEIIIPNLDPFANKLYVLKGDGTPMTGFPVNVNYRILTSVVVGDVDGDGKPELVYGSDNKNLYAMKLNGTQAAGFPKSVDGTLSLAPALGDVDNDGKLDVVAADWNGKVYNWKTTTNWATANAPWPMFGHDLSHTGTLPMLALKAPDISKKQTGDVRFIVDFYTNQAAVKAIHWQYSLNSTTGYDGDFSPMSVDADRFPFECLWNSKEMGAISQVVWFQFRYEDQDGNLSLPLVFKMNVDNKGPQIPVTVTCADTPNDNGGSITVTWTKSPDDGAGDNDVSQYIVYRNTVPINDQIGTVSSAGSLQELARLNVGVTAFADKAALRDTMYYYAVAVSDGVNQVLKTCPNGAVSTDNIKPKAVTNVAAVDTPADQGGSISVSWTRSASEAQEPVTYTVSKGAAATRLDPVWSGTLNSYTDTSAGAQAAYYQVGVADGTYVVTSNAVGPVTAFDNVAPVKPDSGTLIWLPVLQANLSVSWNISVDDGAGANDVQKYKVYRKAEAEQTFTLVKELPAGAKGWMDYTIQPNTRYTYQVTAVDSRNESAPLQLGPQKYTDSVPPHAISDLKADDVPNDNGGSIKVSWTLSIDDGAGSKDVNEYWVYRTASLSQNSVKVGIVTKGTAYYVDSGLPVNQSYFYQVLTVDNAGNSAKSEWSTAGTALDNLVPAAPTNVKASDNLNDNGYILNVSWDLSADDGVDVTGYDIYYSEDRSTYALVQSVAKGTTQATVRVPKNAVPYSFRIKSRDSLYSSAFSSEGLATAQDNRAPAAVSNLKVTDPAKDQESNLTISWTVSLDDSPIGDVTGYTIWRALSANGTKVKMGSVSKGNSSFNDLTPSLNVTYYYSVSASDGAFETGSAEVSGKALDEYVAAPGAFTCTDVPNDQGQVIQIKFTGSPDETGRQDIAKYVVYRSASPQTNAGKLAINVTTQEFPVKSTGYLDTSCGFSSWYYQLSVLDQSGNEGMSAVVGPVAGLDNLPPAAINGLTVADRQWDNGDALVLNWEKSGDDGLDVAGYSIEMRQSEGGSTQNVINLKAGSTSATVLGLSSNQSYQFRVLTRDFGGNSSASLWSQLVKTVDDLKPAPPTGITVADNPSDNGRQLKVSWTLSSDDAQTGDVKNYQIRVIPNMSDINVYTTTTVAKGVNTALVPAVFNGVNYYIQVCALDGTYTSCSNIAGPGQAVDNLAPGAVTNLAAADLPNDQDPVILLTWTLSPDDNANGDVSGYDIYRSLTANGTYKMVGSVLNGISQFKDTAATLNTTFYYYALVRDGSFTTKSTVVNSKSLDKLVRPATDLMAADVPNDQGGSIKVTYNPSLDQTSRNDIAKYMLYRASVPEMTGKVLLNTVTSMASAYSFIDTTPGLDSVYYQVVVEDTSGNSTANAVAGPVQAIDNIPPEKVTQLTVADTPDDQGTGLNVSWVYPASASNNPADAYDVKRSTSVSGPFVIVQSVPSTISQIKDATLKKGTTYYYKVTARDTQAQVDTDLVGPVIPVDNRAPGAVTGLALSDPADNGFNLSVTFKSSADDGAAANDVTGYAVDMRESGTVLWTRVASRNAALKPAVSQSIVLPVLKCQADYEVRVLVMDGTNTAGLDTFVKAKALDDTVDAPLKVTAADVPNDQGGSITISWPASPDNGDNGRLSVSKYRLYRQISGSGVDTELTLSDPKALNYTDSGLDNLKLYVYKVTAESGVLKSLPVLSGVMVPKDNVAPAPPANLVLVSPSKTNGHSLKLSWDRSPDDGKGANDVSLYTIWISDSQDGDYKSWMTWKASSPNATALSNLENGKTYHVRMTASDRENLSEKSAAVSAGPKDELQPPKAIFVTAADVPNDNGGAIAISWQHQIGPDYSEADMVSRELLRATSLTGPFSTVQSWSNSLTSLTDAGVSNNVNYYYQIVYKDDTYLVVSDTVGPVQAKDNVAPRAVTALTGADCPNDSGLKAALSWTLSIDDQGGNRDAANYLIYRVDGAVDTLVASVNAGIKTVTVPTLKDGVATTFKVIAKDRSGLLSPATSVANVKSSRQVLDPVLNLTATDTPEDLGTSLTLTWTVSPQDNGQSDGVTSYSVFRKTASDFGWTSVKTNVAPGTQLWMDTNCVVGESYYYRVTAYQSSLYSGSAECGPVSAVDNKNAKDITDLTVTDVPNDQGSALQIQFGTTNPNAQIAGLTYSLKRQIGSGAFVEVTKNATIPVTFVNAGLVRQNQYVYRVDCVIDTVPQQVRIGIPSAPVSPVDNLAPKAVTNLKAADELNDNGKQIRLTWTRSQDDTAGGDVTQYKVQRKLDTGWLQVAILPIGTTQYIDRVAENNVSYNYQVYTEDGTFSVPAAAEASAKAQDNLAPADVTLLTGADVPNDRGGKVLLTWVKSADDSQSGDVKEYRLYRKTQTDAETLIAALPAGTQQYTATGLVNGVPYTFRLVAWDGSFLSQGVQVTVTAVHNKPMSGAPTSVRVADTPDDQGNALSLSWTKSVDDGAGFQDIQSYLILRSAAQSGGYVKVGAVASGNVAFTDKTVVKGNTYWYFVAALNDSVAATSAIAVSATAIDNIPPAAPANFTAVDSPNDASAKIILNWTKSADDGAGIGDVTGYTIWRSVSAQTGFAKIATLPAGSTQHSDTTVLLFTPYYYRVLASDSTNESAGLGAGPVAAGPDITLKKGMHMISIPYLPDPADTIAQNLGLPVGQFGVYTWAPKAEFASEVYYSAYPEFTRFLAGKGYFVNVKADTQLTPLHGQLHPSTNEELALNPYWNMVGSPFHYSIAKTSLKVKYQNQTVSFDQAIANGWIQGVLWRYDGQSYQIAQVMEPFKGYWLLANKPVTLIIPPVAVQAAAVKTAALLDPIMARSVKETDFVLNVQAFSSNGELLDQANYFGSLTGARDELDAQDMPKPPALRNYFRLYFSNVKLRTESVSQYASDMRAPLTSVGTWLMKVATDMRQMPVTLVVKGLEDLSDRYQVSLYDPSLNKTVILDNTNNRYTTSSPSEFRFIVVPKTTVTDLAITDIKTYPNPWNPSNSDMTLAYKLNKTASGKISIFSISGVKINTIDVVSGAEGGTLDNHVKWDGSDAMGNQMASGLYFFLIQLESADGTSIKEKARVVIWK